MLTGYGTSSPLISARLLSFSGAADVSTFSCATFIFTRISTSWHFKVFFVWAVVRTAQRWCREAIKISWQRSNTNEQISLPRFDGWVICQGGMFKKLHKHFFFQHQKTNILLMLNKCYFPSPWPPDNSENTSQALRDDSKCIYALRKPTETSSVERQSTWECSYTGRLWGDAQSLWRCSENMGR